MREQIRRVAVAVAEVLRVVLQDDAVVVVCAKECQKSAVLLYNAALLPFYAGIDLKLVLRISHAPEERIAVQRERHTSSPDTARGGVVERDVPAATGVLNGRIPALVQDQR